MKFKKYAFIVILVLSVTGFILFILSQGKESYSVVPGNDTMKLSKRQSASSQKQAVKKTVGFDMFKLSREDSQKGLEALLEATKNCSPEEKLRLYGFYASGLAVNDPKSAISWAKNVTDPVIRSHCLVSIFSIWLQDDKINSYEYMDAIGEYKDNPWASSLVQGGLSKLAAENAQSALNFVTSNLSGNENLYFSSLERILSEVGLKDPQKMYMLAQDYELKGGSEIGLANIITRMASLKVSSALLALDGWPGSDRSKISLVSDVVASVLERDPESIINYLDESFPEKKYNIISNNVYGWIGRDPSSFKEWFSKQDSDMVDGVLSNDLSLSGMGVAMPKEAADMVIGNFKEYADQEKRLKVLMTSWSKNNPKDAMSWISEQTVQIQRSVIDEYVSGVNEANPDAVKAIIESSRIDVDVKNSILSKMGK